LIGGTSVRSLSPKVTTSQELNGEWGSWKRLKNLLKESLQIEEGLSGPTSEKVGRRAAELAGVYYMKKQYAQGFPLVARLVPIASVYSGNERKFVAGLFQPYAAELRTLGQTEEAARLEAKRTELGFNAKDFKQ
jgi:hypothetical protein